MLYPDVPLANQISKPIELVVRTSSLLRDPSALDAVKADLRPSLAYCLGIWLSHANMTYNTHREYVREQFVALLARLQVDAVIRHFDVTVTVQPVESTAKDSLPKTVVLVVHLGWVTLGGAAHEWKI